MDMLGITTYSREDYIREIMSAQIQFKHRGNDYYFVPLRDETDMQKSEGSVDGDHIIGQIGRGVLTHENKPPEEGFEETTRPAWQAVPIIIDPTYHIDGQKIAMQFKGAVGACGAVLKSLINHINEQHGASPYHVDLGRIVDESSFWRFAAENKGKVTKLIFGFVAPNMFGSNDEFEKDLRNLRDQERAQALKVEWTNPDGLNTDTTTTKQAVNYANRGKGTIKARTTEGKVFSSESKGQKVSIPERQIDKTGLADSLRKLIPRILKRE